MKLRSETPESIEKICKALRAFLEAHQPALRECTARALQLGCDTNVGQAIAFLVHVRQRPGALETRLAFEIVKTEVVPFNTIFPHVAAEYQRSLDQVAQESGHGFVGLLIMWEMTRGAAVDLACAFAPPWRFTTEVDYSFILQAINNGVTRVLFERDIRSLLRLL